MPLQRGGYQLTEKGRALAESLAQNCTQTMKSEIDAAVAGMTGPEAVLYITQNFNLSRRRAYVPIHQESI